MNYSQKANPNATNSEMDSKTIIKQPQLTTEQWDDLIEQYTEIIVDGMDWKDMHRFVFDTISRDLKELESRQDLCDDIKYTFDEELLDELIDNVTNEDDDEELTTQEQVDYINSNLTEETFIDINNTGGKF
tara:strand:- start:51 stop:443 length:393 start_codon:yes stop_codon:yes gene_type:complete